MPVPILSVSQMRAWEEASWASGRSQAVVIDNVGQHLARRLMELTHPGDSILILAGHGHNGDDARAAASKITERETLLIDAADPVAARNAFYRQIELNPSRLKTWVLDGLFGIGLNRPLNANWIALIDAINDAALPVLAIDNPSGLNVETGESAGAVVQATITLAVGAIKEGLLSPKAAPYIGRLEAAPDIGLMAQDWTGELNWTIAEDFVDFPPARPANGHKGSFGHLAIFAGSTGYHGAAILASRGAQRARPGLISLWTQPSAYIPVASQLAAVMVHPWKAATTLPPSTSGILIGPGLAGEEISPGFLNEMRSLWNGSPLAVLADATALDWLTPGPFPRHAIRIITPHPGEAARLLGISSSEVQEDRVNCLRALSKRLGECWVVLKGNQTLVGRASGEIFVNSTGNPNLAQGGSGDTLAGFLAGLAAQPLIHANVSKAIRFAVFEHGAAADRLNKERGNWTPEDLALELGRIWLSF